MYIGYTQEISCVYTKESLVYARDLLCMHNTLVHALGQGTQGPGLTKGADQAWDRPKRLFWPLGFLAQSMHKSVVHAHEISCVYTRDSFVYTQ